MMVTKCAGTGSSDSKPQKHSQKTPCHWRNACTCEATICFPKHMGLWFKLWVCIPSKKIDVLCNLNKLLHLTGIHNKFCATALVTLAKDKEIICLSHWHDKEAWRDSTSNVEWWVTDGSNMHIFILRSVSSAECQTYWWTWDLVARTIWRKEKPYHFFW